ncbi:isoprenylcysteine carboxylmethyltransferase family protein [Rhodobacteraceae bacterium KMM 6894]|nr:isoprenylcysteine carboxylmethyltransferase family protein [Rhodobacteraceae bacterium KMM 6894]
MKWMDLPPVWLAGALALAWAQARFWSLGLGFGGGFADFLGGVLIGGGLILIALAAWEMRRAHTTLIPNREADKLVTSGIFKRSRNPIYVGDALILAGFILRWDAVPALILLPCFVWIIEKRFVIPEENMLRRKFRADFARYMQKTRRWV